MENAGLKRITHGRPYSSGSQEDAAGCIQAIEAQLSSWQQEERPGDAPPWHEAVDWLFRLNAGETLAVIAFKPVEPVMHLHLGTGLAAEVHYWTACSGINADWTFSMFTSGIERLGLAFKLDSFHGFLLGQ